MSQALGLATLVLVARIVGRAGYGELGIVRSTVGMFAAVGTGLSLAVTKHIAAARDADPERAGRVLWLAMVGGAVVGFVLALGVAVSARHLARGVLNAPALASDLQIGSVLLLVNVLATIQNGSLAGLEAFRALARINAVRGVVGLPLTYGLTVAFGTRGAISGLVVTAAIGLGLGELAIRAECAARAIRRSSRGCSSDVPLLWRFSAVLLLCDLVGPPATWIANTLLVREGDGYAQMGIFAAAVDWMVVAMALPSLITAALLPVSASLRATGDRVGFADFTARALAGIAALSCAISLGLALCAPFIFALYGKSYGGRFGVLVLVLAAAALGNVSNAMRAVAISSDRQTGVLASFFLYGIVMVTAMFFLRGGGASGRAWAHLAADGALCIGLAIVTVRTLRANRNGTGCEVEPAAERAG